MTFEEVELVLCNESEFYNAFRAARTPGSRLFIVGRYFKKLFPDELVTDKKARTLRIHFEKLWLNIEPDQDSYTQPRSCVIKADTFTITSGDTMPASKAKLIETVHYVNGVDVRNLTDDQLIAVIRERELEIAKLNSTTRVPARLKNRANELQAELDALVAFLDGLDNPPST